MTEQSPLQGKVAIVTGAASTIGFGRAMTLALVRAGARVAMMDIDAQSLAQTADEALTLGGRGCVVPIVGDVSQPADAQRVVDTTLRELGGLHILVNNAGTNPRNAGFVGSGAIPFWEVPPQAWFKVAAVNYIGPVLMASAAVKHMLDQKWGRIIGVTTSLDTMFAKGNPTYGSSKAGHEAFMASIAQELEATGVTVNALVPGGRANTNLIPRDTPYDRSAMIQPEVMEAPIVWLSSEDSSSFHGQRVIAYYWDESQPLEERLTKAAAPLAWPQLGRQAIHSTR
jgi:NAD(P)-dependent dehydrogenase (short-subunit alcohol dehydrogenase family)